MKHGVMPICLSVVIAVSATAGTSGSNITVRGWGRLVGLGRFYKSKPDKGFAVGQPRRVGRVPGMLAPCTVRAFVGYDTIALPFPYECYPLPHPPSLSLGLYWEGARETDKRTASECYTRRFAPFHATNETLRFIQSILPVLRDRLNGRTYASYRWTCQLQRLKSDAHTPSFVMELT